MTTPERSPAPHRAAFTRSLARVETRLRTLLARAARRAYARVGESQPEQARSVTAEIVRAIFDELLTLLPDARANAATRAGRAAVDAQAQLLAELPPGTRAAVSDWLARPATSRGVELAAVRLGLAPRFDLSTRVYRSRRLAERWVDRTVTTVVSRGGSAYDVAAAVRDSIRPDVRGGVGYAAMRLGRTETMNAFHVASVDNAAETPWTAGMRWRLSGSHPELDVCDTLAAADRHGLGAGVYRVSDVPDKPHPQCLCVVLPVTESVDEFVEAFRAGSYDAYLSRVENAAA